MYYVLYIDGGMFSCLHADWSNTHYWNFFLRETIW